MAEESANKRIAKNTIFLFFRMLLVMGVSLYTSRVVLASLGVVDYGIYNVVGGIVVILSFLNGCASSATSRFLTFALGNKKNESNKSCYKEVFSVAFFNHIALAFLIAFLAETIGLWYFNTKLIIPPDRYEAAMWVYQISIITVFVSFTQVPYNASIIAYEKMNIYAYVGVFEALYRLAVAYIISVSAFDKLKLYAIMLFCGTLLVSLFYRIYCLKVFGNSCKIGKVTDKTLFKKMLSYSGWELFGNFSSAARSQGVNLILNLFCGPSVNAARAIAYQVEAALYQFTTSFLQASRPVIIKEYAAGNISKSISLLNNTAKFACLLFSCLAIPFIVESDFILSLWLVEVPQHASLFLKIVLANYLIISFNNTINIGVHATGDAKRLNLYAGTKTFIEIPIIYFLLKKGFAPYSAFIVLFAGSAIVIWINLLVLKLNIKEYSIFHFFSNVFLVCLFVIAISSTGVILIHLTEINPFIKVILEFGSYALTLSLLSYFIVLNKDVKNKINTKLKRLWKC